MSQPDIADIIHDIGSSVVGTEHDYLADILFRCAEELREAQDKHERYRLADEDYARRHNLRVVDQDGNVIADFVPAATPTAATNDDHEQD
jgi:hypothetical protein